ncbi:MAG: histidine--tRNA ligase [Prevotella sp.]|nr:histidine--tRNA ligase [Staphylococcus sp.]MCM1350819.1 histidine--tRNA ligase [Prevotella sp.]
MAFIKIPVKGMNEFLPDEMRLREYVIREIKDTYGKFGFNIIETPCMEHIENLCSKQGGDNEKLIFKILKRGEKLDTTHIETENDLVDMGMRYDLTVPLSRYYANNMAKLPSPFKGLQIGNVWRAERPQKGRFRQFMQCDIDILGEKSNLAEIELIQATTTLLTKIGFSNFKVRVNDRRILKQMALYCGLPEEKSDAIFIILDKMDKIGKSGVYQELLDAGYEQKSLEKYMQLFKEESFIGNAKSYFQSIDIDCIEADVLENIDQIIDTTEATSHQQFDITFDPTLVRGMSYYTGTIFEIEMIELASSVAGGGRYDKMIEKFTNMNVPACGFSIGFERIITILKEKEHHLPIDDAEKVAFVIEKNISKVALIETLQEAKRLREQENKQVLVVYKSKNFKFQKEKLTQEGYTDIVLKAYE